MMQDNSITYGVTVEQPVVELTTSRVRHPKPPSRIFVITAYM